MDSNAEGINESAASFKEKRKNLKGQKKFPKSKQQLY